MNEFVDASVRDALIAQLLTIPENKQCFDCKSKNPKWSSSNIGIFLCYQCTSKHRSMGTHISFVRSLKMDRWKRKELKQMELGGNKNAQIFYEENGMYKDGKPDHEAPMHSRQKMDLSQKAEAVLREELKAAQPNTMPAQQPSMQASHPPAQINGLQANPFEQVGSPSDTYATTNAVSEALPQATFQAISVPTSSGAASSAQAKAGGSMQLGKKINATQAVAPSGGISFARKQNNGQVKSLNAKKLDINFGGDDFFNSFQPAAAQEVDPIFGAMNAQPTQKKSNKLQEVDSNDPFASMAGSSGAAANSSSTMGGFGGSNNGGMSDTQAQDRLAQLGNRKAISSADFQQDDQKSAEIVSRFAALSSSGATQISSDMMFGAPAGEPTQAQPAAAAGGGFDIMNIFSKLQQAGGFPGQ